MAKTNKARKLFATTATAALVASAIVPVASAADFTDANKIADWAKEAVEYLADNGIIEGSNGAFNPTGNITRAEAATIFTKALDLDTSGTEPFSDVAPGQWWFEAIVGAYNAGIVSGKGAGLFEPKANLTRAEAAKMIVEAYGFEGEADLTGFSDYTSAVKGKWSEEYLAIAVENEIINGKDGKLAPNQSITRQEFAVMFFRALEAGEEVDFAAELVEALADLKADADKLVETVNADNVSAAKSAATNTKEAIAAAEGALKLAQEAGVLTEAEEKAATDAIAAAKAALEKAEAAIKKYEDSLLAPVVESISALNGGQILVKFTQAVDKTTAETITNYVLSDNTKTIASAKVQADGKSVLLTLTNAYDNKAAYSVAVTVQGVIISGTVDSKFPVYTQVITVQDNVAPEVTAVSGITKDDATKSITVRFSEPVQTGAAFKINGVSVASASFNAAGTAVTLTAQSNLAVGVEHKLEVVNLTDKSGNVNTVSSKAFTITKDAAAPVVQSVVAYGDNALLVTFNKDMKVDATALATLQNNIKIKNDVYNDVGVVGIAQVDGDSETQFIVQLNPTDAAALFSASKLTHNLTVLFVNGLIEDYLGNKLVGTTTTATITKDTVAPEITGVTYKKNSAGQVTSITVNFSEGIQASTLTFPASLVNQNGVVVNTSDVFGTLSTPTVTKGATRATFNVTAGAKVVTGKYSLSFGPGYVKDASLAGNNSKAYATVLDFGTSQAAGDYTITSATAASNVITVVFPESVKGGMVEGSATDLSRYTLNGATLPTGTVITLNGANVPTAGTVAQTIATIVLPAGTISATDTAAIFTVNGVQTLNGKTNKPYTGTLNIRDNVSPVLQSAKVLDNKTIELTYNEAITTLSGADVGDEFTIYQGTTALALGTTELKASSVSGFPTKVRVTIVQGTDVAQVPGSATVGGTNASVAAVSNVAAATTTATVNYKVVNNSGTLQVVNAADNAVVATLDASGNATFTVNGVTVTVTGAADTNEFSVSTVALVPPVYATTLNLATAISIETKVPTSGYDILDVAGNVQQAAVKVDVAK